MKSEKNRINYFFGAAVLIVSCFIFAVFVQGTDVPKVSVIIPVYNSAEFLPECLNSIRNQTFKDIEIICVNDGSKDNSMEILKEYKNKDPRIIIIDKPNGGVSSARNAGLKAAKGKYVQFVDSDDLIHCKTCENLVREAEHYSADIVRFKKTWFKRNETPNINKQLEYDFESPSSQYYYFHTKSKNPFVVKEEKDYPDCNVIHNKFYKRDFLLENNLFFDEEIRLGEDSLFCWMSFTRTNTVVVDENIYYYHRTDINTSLMGSATQQKWFDNHMLMIKYLILHKSEFKFKGNKEWILDWAIEYAMDIFEFGSKEEKAKNAKVFFDVIDDFLKNDNVFISQENSQKVEKIRNLIN